MTRSSELGFGTSMRILAEVSCSNCLMMEPDFPMTPPMREAWQRIRKQVVRGGGCRFLMRLRAAEEVVDSNILDAIGDSWFNGVDYMKMNSQLC
ncbi:hypothetical protein Hanom_Chr12g01123311 [Helianthus anomalus]